MAVINSDASGATDVASSLQIDSLQLLRHVYKQSLSEQWPSLTSNEPPVAVSQLSWILGETATTIPPLLRQVHVFRDEVDLLQFTIQFKRHNLSIHSSAPTQWIDQNGKRFNFGAVILFALQAQTGVTDSHHIIALGISPSLLTRKPLVSVLQDAENQSDPFFYAPQNYSASVLTPISRLDQTLPIRMESVLLLCLVFKMSPSEASAKNVFVGASESLANQSLTRRIESRHCLPARESFRSSTLLYHAPNSQANNSSRLAAPPTSYALPTTPLMSLEDVEMNLLKPSTIIRVSRSLACFITRLLDRLPQDQETSGRSKRRSQHHDPPQLNRSHPSVCSPPTKRPSRFDQETRTQWKPMNNGGMETRCDAPVTKLNERKASATTKPARSLFEVLSLRKWKPIILVPSSSSLKSSPLLHFNNVREFLEHQHLLTSSVNQVVAEGASKDYSYLQGESFPWVLPVQPTQDDWTRDAHVEVKVVSETQIARFKPNDWLRVVAVIVQGPQWQFQNWPFANLELLFNCIRGVYFAYEGDNQLPPIVSNYPVEVLRVKRNSRHSDVIAWNQFVLSVANILQRPRDFRMFDRAKFKGTNAT